MINIFTPGTASLKQKITEQKFDSRQFFCELLALAPGLKIRECCKNLSNGKSTNYNENLYERFKSYLEESCENIEQIMDLSVLLCQNYDFHSYYRSLYLEPNVTSLQNFRYKKFYSSYIEKLDSNLQNFQLELKYFLFLSGLYTYSSAPSLPKTLPQSMQMLSNHANIDSTTAKKFANHFRKQAHDFYIDGLSCIENESSTAKDAYIAKYIYPYFFQEKNNYKKVTSMYDVPILNGLNKRKGNLFYRCLKFDDFELSWAELHKFLNNFIMDFQIWTTSFDVCAMTDYLLERIFNFNFLYAIPILRCQIFNYLSHTFPKSDIDTFGNIEEKLLRDMFSFLPFYPLPRQRILLLHFICNSIALAPINLSFAYLNGFFYQTFIYFPLVDVVFTYLLRLYYTQKYNDLKEQKEDIMKNILKNLKNEFDSPKYSDSFSSYCSFALDQKAYKMFNIITSFPPFADYLYSHDPKNTSHDIKEIGDDEELGTLFTQQVTNYALNKSGFSETYWSRLRNFNWRNVMDSFNHAVFLDIKKINQHIITTYSLPEFNYIPIPFIFSFIHGIDANELKTSE